MIETTGWEVLKEILDVLPFCCLFYGMYRIGERSFSKLGIVILVYGLISGLGAAAWQYQTAEEIIPTIGRLLHQKPQFRELPKNWGEGYTPEQKQMSILLARANFFDHGRLIEYIDQTGKRIIYSPTEKDIAERDKILSATAKFDVMRDIVSQAAYKNLVSGVSVMLFAYCAGVITFYRTRKRTAQ